MIEGVSGSESILFPAWAIQTGTCFIRIWGIITHIDLGWEGDDRDSFTSSSVKVHHPDFLYIGSSVNLRHRWANHKSDCKLRKGHKCHVAQHFLDKQHPVDPQFTCLRIFAIEAVHKKEDLGKRETWWQVNVGTIFLGLNIRSDISALVRNRSRVQY
ncbi:hypothetical protein ACOMHN_046843 [Nucella lapillus]